jgi:HD-GYP domain-containing protein (c-di-GMP phosphodiesterase class II)
MIPTEILNKKGNLTKAEFAIIKHHPVLGYDSIKDISHLSSSAKKAVLLHHERLNGSGYPYGLSGSDIDLCTRIVSIADVYDAMTQNRIYKNKMNPFEAFKIMKTDGIEIFDFKIAETFLRNVAGLLIGLNVLLEGEEVGEIVYIPPYDITSPMIRIGSKVVEATNFRIKTII